MVCEQSERKEWEIRNTVTSERCSHMGTFFLYWPCEFTLICLLSCKYIIVVVLGSYWDKLYYVPESAVVELKESSGSVERWFTTVIVEICCQILSLAQILSLSIQSLWTVPRMFLVVSFLRLEIVRRPRLFLEDIFKVASSRITYNWLMIFSVSTEYSVIWQL